MLYRTLSKSNSLLVKVVQSALAIPVSGVSSVDRGWHNILKWFDRNQGRFFLDLQCVLVLQVPHEVLVLRYTYSGFEDDSRRNTGSGIYYHQGLPDDLEADCADT